MKNWYVYIILSFHLINVLASGFEDQLSQVGVPKADIEKLISNGYTDIVALKPFNLAMLMQMGITGKSALLIKQLATEIPPELDRKTDSSELSPGWKIVEKSLQAIRAMQKDTYEKTSEFQMRRQVEIDKLVEQINTASQQGDVDYQIATAIVESYNADTENLGFSITWIGSVKQLIEVKEPELTENVTKMSPQEARNFPIGKLFPLFASVRWNNDSLYKENMWLDRADLREQAEKEKQQKLDEKTKLEQRRREIEEEVIRKQTLAEEQSRLNELLIEKRQREIELEQLSQKRLENEREDIINVVRSYYEAINSGDTNAVIRKWISPNRKKLESYVAGKEHYCSINNISLEQYNNDIASVFTDVTCDGQKYNVNIQQKKSGNEWKIFEIKSR